MRTTAAEVLPENGIPPGNAKLIPYDDLSDKIQIQKAATPVAVPKSMGAAVSSLNCLRPNAVALERSSEAESDINAQRMSVSHSISARLVDSGVEKSDSASDENTSDQSSESSDVEPDTSNSKHQGAERYVVHSGNQLIDQCQPWHFGVAFTFFIKILHWYACNSSEAAIP